MAPATGPATATRPVGPVDVAVAAMAAASIAFVSGRIEATGGERALDALAYGIISLAGGLLVIRRRWPLVTVAAITAALLVYVVRDYTGGPVFATAWVALYALAASTNRRTALAVAGAVAGSLLAAGLAVGRGLELVHLTFVGWSGAAVFLGEAVRGRRQHVAGLEERAHQLEQSREEETRRRVAEERLRIARDLHDSVAHSMATINVQAGAAARVLDRRPDAARQALTAIQQASADVLDELAALLGVLRPDPGEAAGRSPTPSLDRLDDLVATSRLAGLDVRVSVEGPLEHLAKPVGVAAYRIVQESLTNVARHAGATTATVTITGGGRHGLSVEIVDGGSGGRPVERSATTGVGIIGMRERAEATGGRLEAGPRPAGGFAVRATWPAAG